LELKETLMPVVQKLFRQEPDSHPFRYPVDPDRLNIPVSRGIFLVLLLIITLLQEVNDFLFLSLAGLFD